MFCSGLVIVLVLCVISSLAMILLSEKIEGLTCLLFLSHDVAFVSDITPCNKIDKPLVVYRFSNVTYCYMTPLKELL